MPPLPFNIELEREDNMACDNTVDSAEIEDPDTDEDDLLDLDANDQLRMLILKSHAMSVAATQVRNEFEILHSRAFRLTVEWQLASILSS